MSNKADRQPPHVVIGAGPGMSVEEFDALLAREHMQAPATPRALTDAEIDARMLDPDPTKTDHGLLPGASIEGRPPMRGLGDVEHVALLLRCTCATIVGRVWISDRAARGLPPVWWAETQAVEDAAARPVRVRAVTKALRPGRRLSTSCPAHGDLSVDGDSVIEGARRALGRLGASSRPGSLSLTRRDTRADRDRA